ncbi:Conserved_hypothetical protein [Hexamita inflata]|uniref:Uncharacterized protein n=1 Tax=Hexamita inflata TaxID=28002 RepID=A0AA86UM40_9EUKA|nr:Conserved hypothetical protein [Hexamita inflata]CAI9956742.1 Conserved hypothetical protein [Hexamita inflata]
MLFFSTIGSWFLAKIGFGATGVIAGSIAAGIQAMIGNVAAGSFFAMLQGAAMAGSNLVPVIGLTMTTIIAYPFKGAANIVITIFGLKPCQDSEKCVCPVSVPDAWKLIRNKE